MFKNFKIQKYLDKKPPSNNSFTTMQEIKQLNKIPINMKFVKDKDDIETSFKHIINRHKLEVPKNLIDDLIGESSKVIMKIKINRHLFLLKPYYKHYTTDGTDEYDHSLWWLCFIITWTTDKHS